MLKLCINEDFSHLQKREMEIIDNTATTEILNRDSTSNPTR